MKKNILVLFAALAALLCSCGRGSTKLLPSVSGKAGEVLVVMDTYHWENSLGGILRDTLTQDCAFLPQKEPLYNLVHVTPSNFTQMFQIHRNIILFNVNSAVAAPGVVYKYNKWAQPQIVITVNASCEEDAFALLKDNLHDISNTLEQTERRRVIANTTNYQEKSLAKAAEEFTQGGKMVFPSGYSLKKRTEDFLWISYETTYVQQGIFIYKSPAQGKASELTQKALVARRNAFLKDNVPGMFDGSYMTTSAILAPQVKYVNYNGSKFAELRGFWDVEGDFMGGPFVSHTLYSPDGSTLYTLEAYVYAPKYDKRLYLRQVESLLWGFSF